MNKAAADPGWRLPRYRARVSSTALDEARRALSRGDVLIAYDVATSVVEAEPENLEARFLAALALARGGSIDAARVAATDLLDRVTARPDIPVSLREDAEALIARVSKDRALATAGHQRRARLRDAARCYEEVALKYHGYYSSVNAATLYLLAGEMTAAETFARRALELVHEDKGAEPDEYWRCATEAEAALVLGDVATATRALERAAHANAANDAARAVTRRQLRLVCTTKRIATEVLDLLRCPAVLHYTGHRINDASAVADDIRAFLVSADIGIAYGSLASGADIMIAEAVLERGGELHVVLPFSADEFEETSVAPGGATWRERYGECLRRASSVRTVSDSPQLGEDELYAYAARIAMGYAITRARLLDTDVHQLAVWDGRPHARSVGTAHDVVVWRATGRNSHVIRVAPPSDAVRVRKPSTPSRDRAVRAILFADFHGFARLHDNQIDSFVGRVLRSLGSVLDAHGASLLYRNSWGDAIQAVFTDVTSAAECALALHEAVARHNLPAQGLPADLQLRIGGHAGPVLTMEDPIAQRVGYWGRELTRAARIEPRTPEGQVYVTDAFAALLALEPAPRFVPEYVGRVTTAKDFETIPMFRLRRIDAETHVEVAFASLHGTE